MSSSVIDVESLGKIRCIGEEKRLSREMRDHLPKITDMEKDKFSMNFLCVTPLISIVDNLQIWHGIKKALFYSLDGILPVPIYDKIQRTVK